MRMKTFVYHLARWFSKVFDMITSKVMSQKLKPIEYVLNHETVHYSNLYLRSLWAEFRKVFGKCAWQYAPYKQGEKRKVSFGFMDIGCETTFEVSINYVKKGCIQKITFSPMNACDLKNLEIRFDLVNDNALQNVQNPRVFHFKKYFKCLHGALGNYDGDNFIIRHDNCNSINCLTLKIRGYDNEDALSKAEEISGKLFSVISVETNSVILSHDETESDFALKVTDSNEYSPRDWIDGVPADNGKVLISESAKKIIDLIIDEKSIKSIDAIIGASHLYHSARKIDAQINDQLVIKDIIENNDGSGEILYETRDDRLAQAAKLKLLNAEISTVLYISSLESIVNVVPHDNSRCTECNQLSYSITKRVSDYVESIAGEHIARSIKESYGKRSKFVHEGKTFSNMSYQGVSIPQLDPNSATGCDYQTKSPDLNLREYVSFCIRKTLANEIVLYQQQG